MLLVQGIDTELLAFQHRVWLLGMEVPKGCCFASLFQTDEPVL